MNEDLKREYNKLLARWKKAETVEASITTQKAFAELLKINRRLGKLLDEIGLYSEHEALNGFIVADKEEENNEKTRCKSKLGNAGSDERKNGY